MTDSNKRSKRIRNSESNFRLILETESEKRAHTHTHVSLCRQDLWWHVTGINVNIHVRGITLVGFFLWSPWIQIQNIDESLGLSWRFVPIDASCQRPKLYLQCNFSEILFVKKLLSQSPCGGRRYFETVRWITVTVTDALQPLSRVLFWIAIAIAAHLFYL